MPLPVAAVEYCVLWALLPLDKWMPAGMLLAGMALLVEPCARLFQKSFIYLFSQV